MNYWLLDVITALFDVIMQVVVHIAGNRRIEMLQMGMSGLSGWMINAHMQLVLTCNSFR